MNLQSLDRLLQRAVNFGLALVVTLGMLGGIDALARAPAADSQEMAATSAAPRG
jgi:hypothetical protein